MKSLNYYVHLLSEGCDACPAFNELGHCGAWLGCTVAIEKEELESFMEDMALNLNSLILLFEWDEISNEVIEESIFWQDVYEDLEADRWIDTYKDGIIEDLPF